jgi:heat shock protein HspQ
MKTGMRWVGAKKKNMEQSRSFQLGDHVVARDADHDFAIRGIIFDIDKEFYHVDWGQWGKKPVPINWVESLQPWRLIYRSGRVID